MSSQAAFSPAQTPTDPAAAHAGHPVANGYAQQHPFQPLFGQPSSGPGAPGGMSDQDAEQADVRAEAERLLLSLSQDLYEMEVCAGDVAAGMEGAVPGYLAKINAGFANLSALSRRMTDSVPRQVVESVDANRNPHTYTRTTLSRATGENQYALGRMLGLEAFRRQLHDALAADFPQIPLPERRHHVESPTVDGDAIMTDPPISNAPTSETEVKAEEGAHEGRDGPALPQQQQQPNGDAPVEPGGYDQIGVERGQRPCHSSELLTMRSDIVERDSRAGP